MLRGIGVPTFDEIVLWEHVRHGHVAKLRLAAAVGRTHRDS